MQVINEFKNEKNINNNLFNELKKKKMIYCKLKKNYV